VKEALEGGARTIQYREKDLSSLLMYREGLRIRELCQEYEARYIVNDRIDIALATKADGVHLGQNDLPLEIARSLLPEGIIGVSGSTLQDALEAFSGGADYVGIGPIYPTTTKEDAGKPLGLDVLNKVRMKINIPIVAIGGINRQRVREVIEAGADSLAAISETVGRDVSERVTGFIREIRKWKNY